MAVTDELVLLDATAQAELVRSKQVTPLQLVALPSHGSKN